MPPSDNFLLFMHCMNLFNIANCIVMNLFNIANCIVCFLSCMLILFVCFVSYIAFLLLFFNCFIVFKCSYDTKSKDYVLTYFQQPFSRLAWVSPCQTPIMKLFKTGSTVLFLQIKALPDTQSAVT